MAHITEIGTFNLQCGGHDEYSEAAFKRGSERLPRITKAIEGLGRTVALTDAFGWGRLNEAELRQRVNRRYVEFTPLDDDRLTTTNPAMEEMGLVFATDHQVVYSETVDLGSRNAHLALLEVEGEHIQHYTVYLDDLSPERRESQISSILEHRDEQLPTILSGDFNAFPKDMSPQGKISRAAIQRALPALRLMGQGKSELYESIHGMVTGGEMGLLTDKKATKDAIAIMANRGTPTAPASIAKLGIGFPIDNVVLLNPPGERSLDLRSFKAINTGASDHQAIKAELHTD